MNDNRIPPPPAELLRRVQGQPEAVTITAEIRSDASIPFNPGAAPPFLQAVGPWGSMALWQVDVPWTVAQQIQLWLNAAPGAGHPLAASDPDMTRENAFRAFVRDKLLDAGNSFAEFLGAFLEADVSHGRYNVVIGLRQPITRQAYQTAWIDAINTLGAVTWRDELVTFLRLMLGQASSEVRFIQRAAAIGDLQAVDGAGAPLLPMVDLMIP